MVRPLTRSISTARGCRRGPFLADRRGATAVEFALVAVPFAALMFAIIEAALAFWAAQVLETAVANASRQIYTGQFQTSPGRRNLTAAQLQAEFKTIVCANVTALFDCPGTVSVDIQRYASVPPSGVARPVGADGRYDVSGYGYTAPGPDEICVVRASMLYPIYLSPLGSGLATKDGKRLIMATATFKTEPYGS